MFFELYLDVFHLVHFVFFLQAIKSLKRDFSNFCMESDMWIEVYPFLCLCLHVRSVIF